MSLRTLVLGSVCLIGVAGIARAGEIRGTVTLAAPPTAAEAEPDRYPGSARAMSGAMPHMRNVVGDAVVWVEKIPAETEAAIPAPEAPRLSQKDQSFVPRVVAVPLGSPVDFPNLDPIYHNVFSLSPVKRFDLGKYPRGQSRRVLFDKPGLVNVYCDIHSDMAAFILVVPNRAYAQPDAQGSYHLPPLPTGHYVVHVWHPDRPEQKREVSVPAEGAVTAEFVL
jgi:plastocyanin